MGHDFHFLARLERVKRGEVELALGLYRDPKLVKAILEEAKLDPAVGRIAISLGEGSAGPWALVARDGHFVTCLAADMRHDLPVVSREHLARVAARVQRIREYVEEAKRLTGFADEEERTEALRSRIKSAGVRLSREEFRAAASLEPGLGTQFMNQYLFTWAAMFKAQLELAGMKSPKPSAARALLEVWGGYLGSLGTLAVLGSMAGARRVTLLAPEVRAIFETQPAMTAALYERLAGTWLKALWAAGSIGEPLLGVYERLYLAPRATLPFCDGLLALVTMAVRHPALEGRVREILERKPTAAVPRLAPWLEWVVPQVRPVVARVFSDREALLAEHRQRGAAAALALTAALPDAHELAWRSADEVPPSVAMAMPFASTADTLEADMNLPAWVGLTPFMGTAAAEELFPPEAFVRAVMRPWTVEDLFGFARRKGDGVRTVRRGARTSPNEPCPCGSGKKHKRCCMAVGA